MKFAHAKRSIAIIGTFVVLALVAGAIALLAPHEKTQTPDTSFQLAPGQIAQPVLTDGEIIPYFGTFHDSLVGEDGLKRYDSSLLGLSLAYPKGYMLFEDKNDGVRGISIVPEMSARASISRIRANIGGGGPISIYIYAYPKPASFTTLDAWAKENSQQYTNFQAEVDMPIPTTTPVTVGGVAGIQYSPNYGMYASDNVLFVHGNLIYMVTAEEGLRPDLPAILASIKWK